MEDLLKSIDLCKNTDELEKLKVFVFGKKGAITTEFAKLKDLKDDEKKQKAKILNEFKEKFNLEFNAKFTELKKNEIKEAELKDAFNFTYFDLSASKGAFHPIMSTMDKIIDYFTRMNFSLEEGPIIEDDFHNFEALNLPKFHPARDMQDTFYFANSLLLRTQTSPVQIRTMQKTQPPIRMIAPGAVFRRDFDMTHTPMFHQIEMLVVEPGNSVSFANLKSILQDFLQYMFGDVKVRFRPSFFPFTEPSAEVDISCVFCNAKGCRVCKNTGYIEVMGCGMVHPAVFDNVAYKNCSGYAFGLGVERFAMLIHKIPDLRSLFEGDKRLLEQFR